MDPLVAYKRKATFAWPIPADGSRSSGSNYQRAAMAFTGAGAGKMTTAAADRLMAADWTPCRTRSGLNNTGATAGDI